MRVLNDFRIIVEGDFACYTRPEMKTERVSYDVPTPSALEGMLKAVYWKPARSIYLPGSLYQPKILPDTQGC